MMKGWRGKEGEGGGVECFHSGDQPTEVCNQLLPATTTSHIYIFLLFPRRINSTTLRRGSMQSSLGVIIRTPLGRIAAHARDRSRTRQVR